MWSANSCGLCGSRQCTCHNSMVPCVSTNYPLNQHCYNNILSSSSYQNYQSGAENTIYGFSHASNPFNPLFRVGNDQKAGEQMTENEIVSWLLPDPCNNEIDGSLNLTSYYTANPDHGQFDHMQTHDIQVNQNESNGQSSKEAMVEQQEQTLNFSQGILNDYSTSASLFYEVGEQMATNETDSWLLPSLYNNQLERSLDFPNYCSRTGNQYHGMFDHMQAKGIQVNYNEYCGQSSWECFVEQQEQTLKFSHGIQNDYSTSASLFYPGASLKPTGASIVPEATIGSMNLAQEWPLNLFNFPPFHPGNLEEEIVGSHSNSTRIFSLGTQQPSSRDDLKRLFQFPTMSRKEKVLRYLEKKKSRKYKKKIIHSSRKEYARTRPRVRGRFARSSQTDTY